MIGKRFVFSHRFSWMNGKKIKSRVLELYHWALKVLVKNSEIRKVLEFHFLKTVWFCTIWEKIDIFKLPLFTLDRRFQHILWHFKYNYFRNVQTWKLPIEKKILKHLKLFHFIAQLLESLYHCVHWTCKSITWVNWPFHWPHEMFSPLRE